MPQLVCKGLQEAEVQTLSETLAPVLSKLMGTPEEWFTFEYVSKISYVSGKKVEGEVSVDMRWFDRGQDVQDETASLITDSLRKFGYEEIEVVFHPLKKENFYDNGIHY